MCIISFQLKQFFKEKLQENFLGLILKKKKKEKEKKKSDMYF